MLRIFMLSLSWYRDEVAYHDVCVSMMFVLTGTEQPS